MDHKSSLKKQPRNALVRSITTMSRLFAIALVLLRATSAARRINTHPRQLLYLRGGDQPQQQLNDEDLDEYIDFLLAYADNKATEADNPLFRGQGVTHLSDLEEDLKPMVDDVNDDAQIDNMVETLVASVDDAQIEEEMEPIEGLSGNAIPIVEPVEDVVPPTETIPTEVACLSTTIEEEIIPSIVEESGKEENLVSQTIRTEAETFLTTIEEEVIPSIVEEPGKEENLVSETTRTEAETALTTIEEEVSPSMVEDPGKEENLVSETTPTEADSDAAQGLSDEIISDDSFYLGSSAVESMPVPLNDEIVEDQEAVSTTADDETAPRVPLFSSLMQKMGLQRPETDQDASVTADDELIVNAEASDETELPSSNEELSQEVTTSAEGDPFPMTVTSAVKDYYQGVYGSVSGWWASHKPTWPGKRPNKIPLERDYTKIYQKYFAAPSVVEDKPHSNRFASAILRPWNSVTNYFQSFEKAIPSSEYYSIGIQGVVTKSKESPTHGDQHEIMESESTLVDGADNLQVDGSDETVPDSTIELEASVDVEGSYDTILDSTIELEASVDVVGSEIIELEADEDDLTSVSEEEMESASQDEVFEAPVEVEKHESVESEIDEQMSISDSAEEEEEVSLPEEFLVVENETEIVAEISVEEETEKEDVAIQEVEDIEDLEVDVNKEESEAEDEINIDKGLPEEVEVENEIDIDGTLEVEDVYHEEALADVVEKDVIEVDKTVETEDVEEKIEVETVVVDVEGTGGDQEIETEETPVLDGGFEVPEVNEDGEVRSEDIFESAEDDSIPSDTSIETSVQDEETGANWIPTDIDDEEISATNLRPRRLFSRLWGTRKDRIENDDSCVIDDIEESSEDDFVEHVEAETCTDEEEVVEVVESSRKPNVFMRLWGMNKEANEVYSLGLQGNKDAFSTIEEEVDMFSDSETEETSCDLDVDISVSIERSEKADDSIDIENLEISDSSGEEEDEEDGGVVESFTLADDQDTEPMAAVEVEESSENLEERNFLQLHVPEAIKIVEQEPQESVVEALDVATSTSEPSSSEVVWRLELQKENDAVSEDEMNENEPTPEESIIEDVSLDTLEVTNEISLQQAEEPKQSVDVDEAVETFDPAHDVEDDLKDDEEAGVDVQETEDNFSDLVETDFLESEEVFVEFADRDDDTVLEDEDSFEEVLQVMVSEEEAALEIDKEECFEEEDTVVEKVDNVAEIDEEASEDDNYQTRLAVLLEDDDNSEMIEDVTEADNWNARSEVDDDTYVESRNEYDGVESSQVASFSLEEELESANFVTRFLVNKGLEPVIMIAILVFEWIRVYVVGAILEGLEWIQQGKLQPMLGSALNLRGGALASSVSDDDDADTTAEDGLSDDKEDLEKVVPEEGEKMGIPESDDSIDVGSSKPVELPKGPPPVRPNFLFRRLLNYGIIGHIVIMEMIVASEWLKVYVPQIPTMASYIFYDLLKNKRRSLREKDEPSNMWDAGFVNTGEGSRLGRKPKKARKKEDQKALDQLRSIGDVNQAKYQYVSQKFLERHAIGPYSATISEVELDLGTKKEASSPTNLIEDDVESDSGWILDALQVEEDVGEPLRKSSVEPSLGVSLGSGGPKVSLGLEFNLGGKPKKRKTSSQKLRSVLNSESAASRVKTPKPRVSDSESGVMGRIRAAGANSLVGRSILGAYPGDLPPPDEAGDPRGVTSLARRYGYGDWSDDDESVGFSDDDDDGEDDEESIWDMEETTQSRAKSRSSSRKRRKRRSTASSHTRSSELSTETRPQSRASVIDSTITSGRRRRRKSSGSRLPSLPMEKLGTDGFSTSDAPPRSSSLKEEAGTTIQRRRKPRTLKPALSLLNEAQNSSSKSKQNDEEN